MDMDRAADGKATQLSPIKAFVTSQAKAPLCVEGYLFDKHYAAMTKYKEERVVAVRVQIEDHTLLFIHFNIARKREYDEGRQLCVMTVLSAKSEANTIKTCLK